MDEIIERIKADYAHFPHDQSYDLYTETVYFKDPLTQFRGRSRYRQMVSFIEQWFLSPTLVLHDITCPQPTQILTRWTLQFTAPFPWHPGISISGRSELQLDEHRLIVSHIDTWDCSRWQVLRQLWRPA